MHGIDLYTRKYGTLGIEKENWGVTTHFSEIMKLQFGKERHTLLCILKLFTKIVDEYYL